MFDFLYIDDKPVLNEDIVDQFDDIEDETSASEELAKKDEKKNFSEIDFSEYKHCVRMKLFRTLHYERKIFNEYEKKTFARLIERFLIPYLENCRTFDDYIAGWTRDDFVSIIGYTAGDVDFIPVEDSYTIAEISNKKVENNSARYPRDINFYVCFNTPDTISYDSILYTIRKIYELQKAFEHINMFFNVYASSIYIDGWSQYPLDEDVYKVIMDGKWGDKPSSTKRMLRHFIDVFSKKRTVKKEIDQIRDPNNFMNTKMTEWKYRSVFHMDYEKNKSDMDKCIIKRTERDQNHRFFKVQATVPKGQVVRIRQHWTDPAILFFVDGTLFITKEFSTGSSYDSHFGLSRFESEYQHNNIGFVVEFKTRPKIPVNSEDYTMVVDVMKLHIKNLVIRADERYFTDETELEKVVTLTETENVESIKYEIVEKDDLYSEI